MVVDVDAEEEEVEEEEGNRDVDSNDEGDALSSPATKPADTSKQASANRAATATFKKQPPVFLMNLSTHEEGAFPTNRTRRACLQSLAALTIRIKGAF